MKDTITTLVLFICVGLGFIGSYWWSYYLWHKPVIEEPKVEIIKTPMPEWKAEDNKDKG